MIEKRCYPGKGAAYIRVLHRTENKRKFGKRKIKTNRIQNWWKLKESRYSRKPATENEEDGEDQSYKDTLQMVLKATSWKFEFFLVLLWGCLAINNQQIMLW